MDCWNKNDSRVALSSTGVPVDWARYKRQLYCIVLYDNRCMTRFVCETRAESARRSSMEWACNAPKFIYLFIYLFVNLQVGAQLILLHLRGAQTTLAAFQKHVSFKFHPKTVIKKFWRSQCAPKLCGWGSSRRKATEFQERSKRWRSLGERFCEPLLENQTWNGTIWCN